MTIFGTVKGTVTTAVDTISSVAQTVLEKNRTKAKLNRLRMVMKSESELMNRAYIALGKHYYEMNRSKDAKVSDQQEKLFDVIEKSKIKIAKARECYRQIIDNQNDVYYGQPAEQEYSLGELTDITVACSNESDYKSSPFKSTAEKTESEEKTSEDSLTEEITSVDEAEPDEDEESANEELF